MVFLATTVHGPLQSIYSSEAHFGKILVIMVMVMVMVSDSALVRSLQSTSRVASASCLPCGHTPHKVKVKVKAS